MEGGREGGRRGTPVKLRQNEIGRGLRQREGEKEQLCKDLTHLDAHSKVIPVLNLGNHQLNPHLQLREGPL